MPLYFLTALAYFWLPVMIMGPRLLPKLDASSRNAFWITLAIFYPMAAAMEYVYLYYDIWTFSERVDPLLGPRIYGAPVEEFVYWFGAVPFALLVYFSFCRLFPEENKLERNRRKHARRARPARAAPPTQNPRDNPAPKKELVPLL